MSRCARPTWDVQGFMLAHSAGRTERVEWHIKTYADGHGYALIGGLWVPIAPTLTAVAYLEGVFERMFDDPLERTASGD